VNPFHAVPVAARTAELSDRCTWPSYSKPSSRTRTTMSLPRYRRTSIVPGIGSRGSWAGSTLFSPVRLGSSSPFRKFFGARIRRSASLAISSAPAACSLGAAAPGVRLQTPGDPPDEELLVIRAARLANGFQVFVLELPDRH